MHKRRITARSRKVWMDLRKHAASIQFHSDADLALEGSFHYILGEPWSRPYVVANLQTLLCGSPNELELRAGVDPTLRQRLPSIHDVDSDTLAISGHGPGPVG